MTSPSHGRGLASWATLGMLALGLLLLVAASLGMLGNVAAGQSGGGASPAANGTPIASPSASPVSSPGASPVAGTTTAPQQNGSGNAQSADDAVSSITRRIIHNNPILASAHGPSLDQPIFDPYGLLTPDQAKSLTGDANRLKGAGLPTLVYVRISLNDQQQSQAFAAALIAKPGMVESSKGAQDGLVVLISVPPGALQKGNIAFAYGANALPVNGLDAASIQHIIEQGMLPRLKQGQLMPAIQYGLRQFNYVVAYTPYFTPKLSSTARAVGRWLAIVAPMLALCAITVMVLTWFTAGGRWRRVAGTSWRRWMGAWWPALLAATLCAVLIPLSVYARTRIGIFAAAALITAVLLDVWVTADRPTRRRARRIITATSALPARAEARRQTTPRRPPLRRHGDSRGASE